METQYDDHIPTVFESITISQRPETTPTIMSPFEKLPPELIRNIFDYVPEALCELKLTSRVLNAIVDEIVSERAPYQIVDNISILGRFYVYDKEQNDVKTNDPGTMRVWMEVPVQKSALFEQRVKRRLANWAEIITRDWDIKRGPLGYVKRYSFDYGVPDPNGVKMAEWERLVESIGPRIRKVSVSGCDNCEIATLFNSLEHLHFDMLDFDIANLSDTETDSLLKTVKQHKIEWLSLQIFAVTTSRLPEFLLELSTHVRTLHYGGNFAVADKWAPHIIEMLSRKLDMLEIDHWQRDVLSREEADHLIARLPFLGKKVWFKISFDSNSVGRSNKLNGHIIYETSPIPRPNIPPKDRVLSIIHKSRLNESSPRGC